MKKPKLLDEVRLSIRRKHYSHRTEQAYIYWIRFYIHFHKLRHPCEMREPEVRLFLDYLAVNRKVSASTQNQALCAILYLYREVLGEPLGLIEGVTRRILDELGEATVVATGGLAGAFAAHTELIHHVEPDLTLHGLRILWNINREAGG